MTRRSKPPPPYSVSHAAAIAGCSEALILELAARGTLEAVDTAFGPSIAVRSLVAWLNARTSELRFPPRVREPEYRTHGGFTND